MYVYIGVGNRYGISYKEVMKKYYCWCCVFISVVIFNKTFDLFLWFIRVSERIYMN